MSDMIGYNPSYFFVACWAVITPLICTGVFFFKLITWENLVYQDYHYPWWAHAFGYFMAGSSMVCIPAYAAWLWFNTEGTWREVSNKTTKIVSVLSREILIQLDRHLEVNVTD